MTANPNQPAISVTGLRMSYGDKVVLDGIDRCCTRSVGRHRAARAGHASGARRSPVPGRTPGSAGPDRRPPHQVSGPGPNRCLAGCCARVAADVMSRRRVLGAEHPARAGAAPDRQADPSSASSARSAACCSSTCSATARGQRSQTSICGPRWRSIADAEQVHARDGDAILRRFVPAPPGPRRDPLPHRRRPAVRIGASQSMERLQFGEHSQLHHATATAGCRLRT